MSVLVIGSLWLGVIGPINGRLLFRLGLRLASRSLIFTNEILEKLRGRNLVFSLHTFSIVFADVCSILLPGDQPLRRSTCCGKEDKE